MNNLVNGWDRFFDFDHSHVREAGKVENYRFLENGSLDFDQNQAAWSLFDTLSVENQKRENQNLKKSIF